MGQPRPATVDRRPVDALPFATGRRGGEDLARDANLSARRRPISFMGRVREEQPIGAEPVQRFREPHEFFGVLRLRDEDGRERLDAESLTASDSR